MDKEKLKKLYLVDCLSQRKVAAKLSCSQTTIRYYLDKYKIIRNKRCPEKKKGSKICPRCKTNKPMTEFYKRNREGNRGLGSWCKFCMSNQVLVRQRKYKQLAVDSKGGKCTECGFKKYAGALEFHHTDPTQKGGDINHFTKNPLTNKETIAELKKCTLLCANCHRMVHAGLIEQKEL